MIKYSKAIVNNKCQITFDFTPQNITYNRGNYTATHKGGGSTSRLGIWEGIECISAQIKIGDAAWKTYNLPSNKKVVVEVSSNNVKVQAWGKYRLKTMGYYFKDTSGAYPFFWFGNIGGVSHKYKKGSFKDSMSSKPDGNFHSVNACVPADWKYIKAEWSDWAYKHAASSKDWQIDSGRFAQRNGNATSASYSNGWISDSGSKQIYRKSSLFWFEKEYYSDTVTTSGIAVNPGTPVLKVIPAKGDSGNIELFYKANNSGDGKVMVEAKCKDKTAMLLSYSQSPNFGHDWKKTLTANFNNLFGEQYRANDVTYRARAKNVHGYESSWTAWQGTHRYNGRPTVPKYLTVEGTNGIIYNSVNFSWQASTDPDKDSIVYEFWIKALDKKGNVLKSEIVANKISTTSYKYDISNYEDGTEFIAWVRSNDGLLFSDWSTPLPFEKGAKPVSSVAIISPVVAETDIYAIRPRFAFTGYDSESTCVIEFNGKTYNSKDHSNLFTMSGIKFIFKPNFDLKDGKVSIKAYLKNQYGESKHTQVYSFTKKTAIEKIVEDEIIRAISIKDVQSIIKNMCRAFKKDTSNIKDAQANDYYTAKFYNDCYSLINSINNDINNIVSNNTFDYVLKSKKVVPGEINDDLVWERLVHDIINI